MGYYTDFEIEFPDIETRDIWVEFEEEHYSMEELTYDPDGTSLSVVYHAKWYEYEEDLISFSATVPDKLIIVKGVGEEPGDVWKQTFLNGKASPKAEEDPADFNWDMLPDPEV
jgi:hypothetical protein